jgi:hypothetical protein
MAEKGFQSQNPFDQEKQLMAKTTNEAEKASTRSLPIAP